MEEYTTLRGVGTFTYEEKKSVFIGEAAPVTTEEEAIARIASVKKKYSDANHHVYAYILRQNSIMRFSDDREPQGTAGLPTLDILRKGGIMDAVIVVTRYFGGTLLGTGGLVRSYTSAAAGAVRAAGIACFSVYVFCEVRLSYADYPKTNGCFDGDFRPEKTLYDDGVTVCGSLKKEKFDGFCRSLTEATAGRAAVRIVEEKFDC